MSTTSISCHSFKKLPQILHTVFFSDHFIIDNYWYLLSFRKIKRCKIKSNENILIFDILYKLIFQINLIDPRPLRIRFDKRDEFIGIFDGTRYLTFLGSEKYDAIYNRITYLISQKRGIKYTFSHLPYKNQR